MSFDETCNVVHLAEGGVSVSCTRAKGHQGHHQGEPRTPWPPAVSRDAVPIAKIQLADRLEFICPEDRRAYVQTILSGARYLPWLADRIARGAYRRVLDVGCGEGAFAVFVWSQNPRVWVDQIEPDAGLRRLAEINAPPGTKTFEREMRGEWDLVRWGYSSPGGPAIRATLEIYDFCTP